MNDKLEIVVDYEESDIGKMLDKILKESTYKKELLKLLTPLVCQSPEAVKNFIKIHTGITLPEPYKPNTCAYVDIDALGWGADIATMKHHNLIRDDNTVLVSIVKHIGYHLAFDYEVSYVYKKEVDETGKEVPVRKQSSVKRKDLMVFKEF
jgi:hypothetical protein